MVLGAGKVLGAVLLGPEVPCEPLRWESGGLSPGRAARIRGQRR